MIKIIENTFIYFSSKPRVTSQCEMNCYRDRKKQKDITVGIAVILFKYLNSFFFSSRVNSPSKLFFRYDVASSDLHLEERTKGRKNLLLERWRGRKFRGGGQALLQELNWKGKQIPLDQTTLVNRWPVVGDWSNFFPRARKNEKNSLPSPMSKSLSKKFFRTCIISVGYYPKMIISEKRKF